ncbi:MAG TPA: hypothetical protein VLC98_07890 [Phnomibacter sp.]|nr:hypothetical protein [Phnomibacter sp.]
MKLIFGALLLLLLAACYDQTRTGNKEDTGPSAPTIETKRNKDLGNAQQPFRFDDNFTISSSHHPYMVTGYFNPDNYLDTAILVRHKQTGKDVLFIQHGETPNTYLLLNGKQVGANFPDYNWVSQFEVVKKGTKIWNNVIDGEIVGEEQVPENKKITLQTDAIFVHVDEAGGGGIIYYQNNKYVWVQQD